MIPSKKLRKIISKKRKVNLEAFKWDPMLEKSIFKIIFWDGNSKSSLREIYKNGYNIGNCLLTAYYIASIIDYASICTGKVNILKGTKNAPSGDHVWIETDEYILDTTLMIKIPLDNTYAKLYKKDYSFVPNITSNNLSYSDELYAKNNFPELYYLGLYQVEE